MNIHTLTPIQERQFKEDGYLIVRNFFKKEEINKIYEFATENDAIHQHSYGMMDKDGKASKLALWFEPGSDVMGLVARSKKIVDTVDQLLEGNAEVCHYHSKLMQKEPHVGGAWEWHQDYGYWYRSQFPFPGQLMSVMTALTSATEANGCLQVIKGSHKMGRIEHHYEGQQMGADMKYVNQALDMLEHVFVILQPGDALFFHSNILHRSEANTSDKARWSFITAYSRKSNMPLLETSKSCITPIEVVDPSCILQLDPMFADNSRDFLSIEKDANLK